MIDEINAVGWGVYSATQFDRDWTVVLRPFDHATQLIGRGRGPDLESAVFDAWSNREEGTIVQSFSIEAKPSLTGVMAALRGPRPKLRRI